MNSFVKIIEHYQYISCSCFGNQHMKKTRHKNNTVLATLCLVRICFLCLVVWFVEMSVDVFESVTIVMKLDISLVNMSVDVCSGFIHNSIVNIHRLNLDRWRISSEIWFIWFIYLCMKYSKLHLLNLKCSDKLNSVIHPNEL